MRRRRHGPGDDRGAIQLNVRILFVCMGNICRSPTAEGVMRALVREAGLEDEIEIDSAGTGTWHAGDPPDRRATAAARRARRHARGRGAPGPPERLRGLRPAAGDGPREPRDLRAFAPDGDAASKARLLREFDPARRRARPRRARPLLRRRPDGFENVLDQVEAACRGLLDELAVSLADAVRAATGREVASGRARRRRRHQRGLPRAARGRVVRRSSRRARTPAPGEYAAEAAGLRWLAEPGALRVPGGARRRPTRCSCSTGSTRAAAATRAALRRRASRRSTPRARAALRRRRAAAADRRRSGCRTTPRAPDWPTFYAERRPAPAAPARAASPRPATGGRARVRPDRRARRAARAARAPARRPVERQRALGPRRPRRG